MRAGCGRGGLHRPAAIAVAILCLADPARAEIFNVGEVDGIIDVTLAYGLLARTESRDPDFIGIGNGGRADSVNGDDGTLNYDTGLVANEMRVNADLTLVWQNFGFFIRGFGFYDFESDLNDREHSNLTSDGQRLVGSGAKLREYYLSAFFTPWGIPVQMRVGDQVINWGEGSFLRFGTDVVNPLDLVQLVQPTASARDAFIPQGMIWIASNITEIFAIEALYQYRWEDSVEPPVGWFFSADDLQGGDGPNFAMTGAGEFSDLGTDLDEAFGLPSGTLGFDRTFMRIPAAGRNTPKSQGQYGFTIQAMIPALNASKLGVHFLNYHSRLPLISGITADQQAIDLAQSIGAAGPTDDEVTLALGRLANHTRYRVEYPEHLRMLGASFNTATAITGTLIAAEISHHFNWPTQIFVEDVLDRAMSPIVEGLAGQQPSLGAKQRVSGIDETHRTQFSMNLSQVFGPRFGTTQSLISFDLGWVHFAGLRKNPIFDDDSWGYKLTALVNYEGVFGGLGVEPFAAFTHDFAGTTPGPQGAFLEDRKSIALGVTLNYTNRITANLTYVNFFDGKPLNAGVDRDFLSFNIRYYY